MRKIIVITRDGANALESQKVIDHDNSSDRKWLSSHCFWAMRNGRSVCTAPVSLEEASTMPRLDSTLPASF